MALRYLGRAEGQSQGDRFLRFITYVSIGGVALGVAALLLSLAIVRGFGQEITRKIIGFGSDIQVRNYLREEPLDNASSMRDQIEGIRGVADASPMLEGVVLLRQSRRSIDGVRLLGTDRVPEYLKGTITRGAFRLTSDGNDNPPLIVGSALASRLGIEIGQTVTVFSLRGGENGQLRRPRLKQFVVNGIYETSLLDIDDHYVITGLSSARQLLGVSSGAVSRFDVDVQDISKVDSLATQIEDRIGFPAQAQTIYEIQPYSSLFAWVDLQKSIIPLVIGVIVLVAAFNIIGTLLMIIVEKTREIGVLQSLGTSQKALKRLFLTLGLLIGVVGTAIGASLALCLGLIQQQFELIPLPAEAYYMTTAPIELDPLDYVIVSVLTIGLCGLAAYIPARVAANVEPVRAIRFQ